VRTTAEQDAAKAKERAEKLAAFRHLRDKLFGLKVANAAADPSLRPKGSPENRKRKREKKEREKKEGKDHGGRRDSS
jgi:hypothetical protein